MNPNEKKVAERKAMLKAIKLSRIYQMITESTCGEACWQAREDICRCGCGGKNHGVIPATGKRPERTRKIAGHLYQLVAVEAPDASCRAAGEQPLRDAKRALVKAAIEDGLWKWNDFDSEPGYPAKIKIATQSEVSRWPELAPWRSGHYRPAALWVRCDMAHLKERSAD